MWRGWCGPDVVLAVLRRPAHAGRDRFRLIRPTATLAVVSRLDRITSDPEICHGQPVVRGLRYPVQTLLELMASGMTFDEILADYEDLERDDLLAALEFGALAAGGRKVPLGAA